MIIGFVWLGDCSHLLGRMDRSEGIQLVSGYSSQCEFVHGFDQHVRHQYLHLMPFVWNTWSTTHEWWSVLSVVLESSVEIKTSVLQKSFFCWLGTIVWIAGPLGPLLWTRYQTSEERIWSVLGFVGRLENWYKCIFNVRWTFTVKFYQVFSPGVGACHLSIFDSWSFSEWMRQNRE